jgi:hypothetical protein
MVSRVITAMHRARAVQSQSTQRPVGVGDVPAVADLEQEERRDLLFAYGMFFARSQGHRMPGWTATAMRGAGAALLCLAATAFGVTDLTPVPSHYEVEGARFPNVSFRDGARRITYAPPAGWELAGEATRLTLKPQKPSQAEASIEVSALKAPRSIDQASAPVLAKEAAALLPRDAEKVEAIAAALNPLRIDGLNTFDVTLRYQLFGQTFQTGVLVLARGPEQWRFIFTARAHDFARAHEAFRVSLYSFQGLALPPG